MKDLTIITLTVALLIGGWLYFMNFADTRSQQFQDTIKTNILPAIEAENWTAAEAQLETLNRDWHKFRSFSLFFLDTHTINDIDFSLARSIKYAQAKDDSNSTGELAAMIEQLSFLTSNESLSPQNIF